MFVQGLRLRAPGQRDHAGPPVGRPVRGRSRPAGHRHAAFGPFIADYSRYLPEDTSGWRLFWAIYAGNVLSTVASCAVGAYLAALLPKLTPVGAVGQICGKWALVIMTLA